MQPEQTGKDNTMSCFGCVYLWWRAWVECGQWYNHTVATVAPETSAPHPSPQKPPEAWWGRTQWSIRDTKSSIFVKQSNYLIKITIMPAFKSSPFLGHKDLTFIPKDCILAATSLPILPSPTIPRTFPYSSAPMNCKIISKTLSHSTKTMWSNTFSDHIWLVMTELSQTGKHGYGTAYWHTISAGCT